MSVCKHCDIKHTKIGVNGWKRETRNCVKAGRNKLAALVSLKHGIETMFEDAQDSVGMFKVTKIKGAR